jgi:hypothetical protein
MKNAKLLLLLIISFLAVVSSCKKDELDEIEQPRCIERCIYSETANIFQKYEDSIQTDRSKGLDNMKPYDYWGRNAAQAIDARFKKETPDMIDVLVTAFGDSHWDHPDRSDVKVWKKLHIGVAQDMYRYMPGASEELLKKLFTYVAKVVYGGHQWVAGTRDPLKEAELADFLNLNGTMCDTLLWTYKGQIHYKFADIAAYPEHVPDNEKDGLFNQGWFTVSVVPNTLKSTSDEDFLIIVEEGKQ